MNINDLARDVAEASLSPMERVRFLNLCHDTSAEGLNRARERVEAHLDYLEGAQSLNRDLDLDLGRQVAGALTTLIDDASSYDDEQRALLRGAVEYFTLAGDSEDDLSDPKGLEDDARVANAVADALGHSEVTIGLD